MSSSLVLSNSPSEATLSDELLVAKLDLFRDQERLSSTYLGNKNIIDNVVWINVGRGHRLVAKELVDSWNGEEDDDAEKDTSLKFSKLPSVELSVIARISREDCWLAPDGLWKGMTKVTPTFADLKLSCTAESPGYPDFDTEFDRALDNIQLIMAARETPSIQLKKGLLLNSESTGATKIKFRHALFIRKEDEDAVSSTSSDSETNASPELFTKEKKTVVNKPSSKRISVLSLCFSHRAGPEGFLSFAALCAIPWPRLCIILIFIDSWLFLLTSGIMTFGVGLHLNDRICASAIYLCIGFYATSKILIYAYLIEKVHIVWSPSTSVKRFKSPMYIICMIALSLYLVILALMSFPGNTHFIRSDGVCVIGLKAMSSIPLLSYDLFVNVALTALFLWPLLNSRTVLNPTIRRVAVRTLFAATVALMTSFVNILILTLLNNRELGWVCLGSCGVDVIINALAIFWVTAFRSNGTHANAPQERADLSKADVETNRTSTLLSVSRDDISPAVPKDSTPVPPVSLVPPLPILAVKKSPSVFARLFRKRESERKSPSIQVMVTTEYEMDDPTLEYGAVASNYRDAPFRETPQ